MRRNGQRASQPQRLRPLCRRPFSKGVGAVAPLPPRLSLLPLRSILSLLDAALGVTVLKALRGLPCL
jgi:hypothetical protein